MIRYLKRSQLVTLLGGFALAASLATVADGVHADPYIRDDVNDTGIEPNPTASVMYLSPDIGVSNIPLAGWNPLPHSAANPPAWAQTLPSDNPEYRSPRSGQPNYIYVRVTNKGSATTGSERLLVYWASASTGLTWDPNKVGGSFVDNVQNNVLLGQEITKPRKNAATASPAERLAYVNAILKIAASPYIFPLGTDYWRTQEAIHRFGPGTRHHTPAFLPWHREFVNRYEGLLQEADPNVKLLYWNWNDDPVNGPLDFFTSAFMGASGRGTASGATIGAPLSPITDGAYANFYHPGNAVKRRLKSIAPPSEPDSTVLSRTNYYDGGSSNDFSYNLENFSHDPSHTFIGGSWAGGNDAGDMSVPNTATRDPFFFLLHTKVDELWARWQRQSLVRLDPGSTFGNLVNPATLLTDPIQPWAGTASPDTFFPPLVNNEIQPWTNAGGEKWSKPGDDRSVVSPPFYDTAPLTIPVLQPGEEVIIEIPWYPPPPTVNPNDPGHICLVARIETSTSFPYGMTVPETSSIDSNTRKNNNIAWRNVHIVDTFPGPFRRVNFIMRNVARAPVTAGLLIGAVVAPKGATFAKQGTVRIDLGPELFKRWRAANGDVRGVQVLPDGTLRMSAAQIALRGMPFKVGEEFPIAMTFELKQDYRPTAPGEPIAFDVVQTGLPERPQAAVGGNRYNIDLEKLVYVKQGETWRWLPGFKSAPRGWTTTGFDDSAWYQRRLEMGLDDLFARDKIPTTTYFRRVFDVDDPGFVRNLVMRVERGDGAIVYLNGKEVYRVNMPDGGADSGTYARAPLSDIERHAFFQVALDKALVRRGHNVVAAEIHRAERGAVDPAFDLELDANWHPTGEPPVVAFANVVNGSLAHAGKPLAIDVAALSTAGDIRAASLNVDGKDVQTLDKPPFRFVWTPAGGVHHLTATVVDVNGSQSRAFTTVTGVKNVPPRVEIVEPAQDFMIDKGDTVTVTARADDSDGQVVAVDFFVDDRFLFTDPERFVGTDEVAPYTVTLKDLKVGDNMIMAIARDNDGARSVAVPVMVMVRDTKGGAAHRMP